MAGSAVRFTETMTGYVMPGAADPGTGYTEGRRHGHACTFHLTIEVDDVAAHLAAGSAGEERLDGDPVDRHLWARARGWVECDLFPGRHPVLDGRFRLFDPVADPDRRAMRYQLPFADGAGAELLLVGRKDVADDPGFDVWSDTTRLSVEISRSGAAAEHDDEVLARGILVITPLALARQLTTFRGSPGAVLTFLRAFGTTLWRLYRPRRHHRSRP